jgi:glucose/arabinose dehydrogenase
VLADHLEVTWGVAFLPGGDALVGERMSAKLLRVTPDGDVRTIGKVPGVHPEGEGGLLGLAQSPSYQKDHFVYAYLTAADDNRIVRFTLRHGRIGMPKPIVTGIAKATFHNGGRLVFGPHGMLYASTGDAEVGSRAQDLHSLNGKILRMTPEGKPAPGNPFEHSLVYSYGHRNVEGLTFDRDGRLWATEFGASLVDEVNLIKAGHNYGWPAVQGRSHNPKFTNPKATKPTEQASPSGAQIAGGALYAAALRGERLYRFPLWSHGHVGRPNEYFKDRFGRLRSVQLAPDGSLWVTTSNRDGRGNPVLTDDRIIRVPLVP